MDCTLSNLLAKACFAMLVAALSRCVVAQGDLPAAYVTIGNSAVHHDIRSFEILMDPLPDRQSPPVVTALTASHDGKYLAAAGDDHAIRIIEVETGRTINTILAHDDWIQSVVFASDSQTLFSAGNDGRVLQWNNSFPVEEKLIIELPYAIRMLSVSTEKELLAMVGFSDEIIVWDLRNSEVKFRLPCDCADQRCVRFSPDGNHLLCGGRDGELRVWDIPTGRLIVDVHEHQGRLSTAAFNADGSRVTSVGDDRRLIQFDIAQQRVVLRREMAPSKLMSMCMVNNDLVAVAGADNSIHLYDALADQVVARLSGHVGTVAVMTPCGNLLASGSFDTTIRIWDLESIGQTNLQYGKPVSHAPIEMDAALRIR